MSIYKKVRVAKYGQSAAAPESLYIHVDFHGSKFFFDCSSSSEGNNVSL